MPPEYVLEMNPAPPAGSTQPPKTIVGYCWPWTARPGERIDFKVSAHAQGAYQAELVRVICGDSMSATGRYKEEVVPASFAGTYTGRYQAAYPGSFVHIPAPSLLDRIGSFTVQTMLFPTCLPARRRKTLPASEPCEQYLVSRWDSQRQRGWALLLDGQDRLEVKLGGAGGVHDTIMSRPLIEGRWYFVAASFDADTRRINLILECLAQAPANAVAEPRSAVEASYPKDFAMTQAGPLLFAACADGIVTEAGPKPIHCFNGRLDRVRISGAALDYVAARSLCAAELPAARPSIVGFWDFSADINGVAVRDLSGNGLHGTTVNVPMRAVTGVDWDGSACDWRHAPQHYSAIHFHDDDLYDALWQTDFDFRVPDDLPSGVYAARLRQGLSEDYIPFFVAPPKGKVGSSVAVLLPTATYTAYTNVPSVLMTRVKVLREAPDGRLDIDYEGVADRTISRDLTHVEFQAKHARQFGAGVYARHSDGTLRTSASQKHPNMSIKPKGMNWTLVADTYLTDWLESKKISYDILTDDLLHREGLDLLKKYRVVLTGNHPEYYSAAMLDAVSAYQSAGGRWMYLGGNGFFWVTSFHAELPGLIEVRKSPAVLSAERRHAFDGASGGLWRENGRAPQLLVGVGTSGVTLNSACSYQRLPDSYNSRASFIFKGVENKIIGDFGIIGGGAAGQEVDRIGKDLGSPGHTLHLARAERVYQTHPMDDEPAPLADVVFFEGPSSGAVFSVGSMAWVGALSHNGYDNDISRITENVLRRFMDARPF